MFKHFFEVPNWSSYLKPGADLGGEGRAPPPPSGIRPPADPKGPPFNTFSEIHFWPTDPKLFPSIYTNFEGERAPKKTRFFCQNFSISAQKRLLLTVFSKICLRRRKFIQNRGKTVLWESSKNQFGRLKKNGRQNFRFFLKIRPTRSGQRIEPLFFNY